MGPSPSPDRRRSSLRIGLLIFVLLLVASVLLERAIVTDAERLHDLFGQLAEALEDEDRAAMERLLEQRFSYSGPSQIGDGDRAAALDRLDAFWAESSEIRLSSRGLEVVAEGNVGVISGTGRLLFKWSDMLSAQTLTFEVAAIKIEDEWVAQGVRVTEFSRGVF